MTELAKQAFAGVLCSLAASGAVEWKSAETTQTQAILRWQADEPASCTVAISESQSLTPSIHDVDPVLFPGAESAARFRTLFKGRDGVFIAGERAYGEAKNGGLYSRALRWDTVHHYQIHCPDGNLTGTFKTALPAMGATRGMALTPHPTVPGAPAWPTIDWSDRSKIYVDPQTGAPIRRLTGPQTIEHSSEKFGSAPSPGPWTNAEQVLARDGKFATVSGSTGAMFVKWNYKDNPLGSSSYQNQNDAIDYVQVILRGKADSPAASADDRTVQVALTVDGVNPATPWKDCVLGPGNTECTLGSRNTMDLWQQGGGIPLGHQDMARRSAPVKVSGNKVEWNGAEGADPNYFSERWSRGSRVSLNGTECTIESVDDHRHLTLTSACGSSGPYIVESFGILIRKKTAQATAAVDSVEANYGTSRNFGWSAGGITPCNPTLVTSVTPNGYVCWLSSSATEHNMYFAPVDGSEWRFIGRIMQGIGPENGIQGCPNANPGRDPRNPARIFCSYSTLNSTNIQLISGTYRGDFKQAVPFSQKPGSLYPDYAGYPFIPTCKGGVRTNCISWTSLTPPGKDIVSMMKAAYPDWEKVYPTGVAPQCGGATTYYGFTGVSYQPQSKSLHAFFICQAGIQNSAQLWFIFDLGNEEPVNHNSSTIRVIAARDTWSKPDQRWTGGHSAGLGVGSAAGLVIASLHPLNADFADVKIDGLGPYTTSIAAPVSAAVGDCGALKSNPLLPSAPRPPTDGCITVKVQGEPCDDTMGTAEGILYNKNPADHRRKCGRENAFYRQDALPGDYFLWPDDTLPKELMRLVDKGPDGHTWTFARGYYTSVAERYLEAYPVPPRAHASTRIMVYHNISDFHQPLRAGAILWDYVHDKVHLDHGAEDSHGAVYDELGADGWEFNYYAYSSACPKGVTACYAGKTGVMEARFEKPTLDFRINAGPGFQGLAGGAIANAIDTHPAPAAKFFVDGRAVNGGFSPEFARVAGTASLYHIPNASFTGPYINNSVVPKIHDIVGFVGHHPLKDISGLKSLLRDGLQDEYKMCFALVTGECRSGSAAGELYVNAPSASPQAASLVCCGSDRGDVRDIVVFRDWSLLGAYTQTLLPKDDLDGRGTRILTYGLNTWSRHDTFMPPGLSVDGKTLLFRASWVWNYRSDVYAVSIPEAVEDNVRRNAYIPIKIQESMPAGAARMRVKFGYNPQFYCMNRTEVCYAVSREIPAANPFLFAHEITARSGDAFVQIPALSNRVLYWSVEFLDAAGAVVSARGPQITAVQ